MTEAARFDVRRVLVAVLMLLTAVVGVAVGHAATGSMPTVTREDIAGSPAIADYATTEEAAFLAGNGVTPAGAGDLFGCDASCVAECGLLGLTCAALLTALLVSLRGPVLTMSWGARRLLGVTLASAPLSRAPAGALSLHQLSVSRT